MGRDLTITKILHNSSLRSGGYFRFVIIILIALIVPSYSFALTFTTTECLCPEMQVIELHVFVDQETSYGLESDSSWLSPDNCAVMYCSSSGYFWCNFYCSPPAYARIRACGSGVIAGEYDGIVTIHACWSDFGGVLWLYGCNTYETYTEPVHLSVLPTDFSISPSSADVEVTPGCPVASNSITVTTGFNTGIVSFTLTGDQTWLSAQPGGFSLAPESSATSSVSINAGGLGAGIYNGNISVKSCTTEKNFSVSLKKNDHLIDGFKVSPNPLWVDPNRPDNELTFTARILNPAAVPVTWTLSMPGVADPVSGSGSTVDVTLPVSPLVAAGRYPATLTVTSGCTGSQTLYVDINDECIYGCCDVNTPSGSATNYVSGNLFDTQDIVPAYGSELPVSFSLAYNSLDPGVGPLGKGWTHNYNMKVSPGSSGVLVLTGANGEEKRYYNDGTGTYRRGPTKADQSTIVITGGLYQLTAKNGTVHLFDGASGRLLYISDRNGNEVTFTYNGNNLVLVTEPYGRTISLTYDGQGRISSVADPVGRLTQLAYDSSGYLSTITAPSGNVRSFTYDPSGRMLTKTDEQGNITTYVYDAGGRVISSTNASGTKTIAYGTDDTAVITERDGQIWTYGYDFSLFRPTAVTGPGSTTKTRTYDANGNLTSETDAEGNTTSYTYDGAGNMLTVTDALDNTTTYTYNGWGQATSVSDSSGNMTVFTYDEKGNLLSTTDPLGNISTMFYNERGRLIVSVDPKDSATYYTYDVMGRVKSVEDPLGNVTRYTYTADDKIATVTDAKNQTIQYGYDALGRVMTMTDQLGISESYTYDQYGNTATVTDRKGQTTEYIYDSMSRITNASYADGNSTAYAYDTLGRLTTITDSVSGVISYEYSTTSCGLGCSGGPTDKVTNETTPLGSVSYTYDAIGRRTSMTVEGQPTVNYSYDGASRVTGITTLINAAEKTFEINYDDLGRRTSLMLPNGVTTNYTYDEAGHLLDLQHINSSSAAIESIAYIYDENGNRISVDRATAGLPGPSSASNILYNAANRMLSFNAEGMTYDLNGNMTTLTNSCGTTSYIWDARNRLVAINGFTPDCSALTASFTYDALNRRIGKTINGRTIQYLYDGTDIVQEIEGGTPTVNYIRTQNIDEPLARIESDGTVRYYHADALGSIIALTDETGVLVTQYVYEPFGKVTILGEISDNPFQYTGRENDGTGLYYYRARYYSPELQRFISEDPIGLQGGDVNFYSYVNNQPVNYIDSFGLAVVGDPNNGCPPGRMCLDPGLPPPAGSGGIGKDIDWGGVSCKLVCGFSTSLVCWGLGGGAGAATGGPGWIISGPCKVLTRYMCRKICPPCTKKVGS